MPAAVGAGLSRRMSAPSLAPPPLTPAEAALFEDLRRAGLHPYRAHEALRRVPGWADMLV